MANIWASNYPIPSSTRVFDGVWKLTRCMKAAGWLYKAGSDGTTKDTSGVYSNDPWGAHADPTLDTMIGITNAAWEVLKGPDTVKVPITGAPTGTPLRGETITQATSLAEGELLGFVWDSVGASGYMVILPRSGTFDNTHTITGSSSGSTFTPTGTIIVYSREVMFFKPGSSDVTTGAIYYICADASADATQFFSYLAANAAGCTATVGPGMGGTGNGFPSKALCVRGAAGSTSTANAYWFGGLSASFQTNFQICATNVEPSSGVSPDGTFWCVATNSTTVNSCAGFGFMRLDDTEPGDCEPFVWFRSTGVTEAVWNNTSSVSYGSVAYDFAWFNMMNSTGPYPFFMGYQAKGHASLDSLNLYRAMMMAPGSTTPGVFGLEVTADLAKPMQVVNSPAATRPLIGEPIGVISKGALTNFANAKPQYKGRCRWMAAYSVGNTYDTFSNKSMLGVSVATTTAPCIAIGPYDGTTTPVQ